MPVRQRKSGSAKVWVVDVRHVYPDGRVVRHRKDAQQQTRKGAEQEERDVREAMAKGTYRAVLQVPTLTAFVADFMAMSKNSNKPSTVTAKRQLFDTWILPAFGHKRLCDITPLDIERLKSAMLAEERTAKTVNNMLTVLKRCLGYAVELGIIKTIPFAKFIRDKAVEKPFAFLTKEELKQLLAAVNDPVDRAAILCACDAGLRMGEILGLQWGDIDKKEGRLTVSRSIHKGIETTPKDSETRRVPMTDRLSAALQSMRHLRRYVFSNIDGTPWTRHQIDWRLKLIARRAGLQSFGWHTLRHTMASLAVMGGMSLYEVQRVLGHSTAEMTTRYAHLAPDHLRDAIRRALE